MAFKPEGAFALSLIFVPVVVVSKVYALKFALVAFSTHSRIAVNQSSEQLLIHQAHANEAIKLEVNATDLELEKAQLKSFIAKYQSQDTLLDFGDVIATITNLLPESLTLEEFALDFVRSEEGKGINGRLAGFALSDEVIANVVSEMQGRKLFSLVRMDFSRSRVVREKQARGFSISFFIDLSVPFDPSQDILVGKNFK